MTLSDVLSFDAVPAVHHPRIWRDRYRPEQYHFVWRVSRPCRSLPWSMGTWPEAVHTARVHLLFVRAMEAS